jgi:hypothetical protein
VFVSFLCALHMRMVNNTELAMDKYTHQCANFRAAYFNGCNGFRNVLRAVMGLYSLWQCNLIPPSHSSLFLLRKESIFPSSHDIRTTVQP